jgi:hypothetical protein
MQGEQVKQKAQEAGGKAEEKVSSPMGSGKGGELSKGERQNLGKLMKSPAAIGTATGAVVLGAAAIWGALEAVVGAGAAYVAYRILRKRDDSRESRGQSESQPQAE